MSVTLVIGASGSGKSTSIRTLPPDKTVIFSVSKGDGKALPFKGWKASYSKEKKNFFVVQTATELKALLTKGKEYFINNTKYLVVDDMQYLMAFEFLKRAKEAGFNKFTEIAQEFIAIVDILLSMKNIHCFVLQHTEDIVLDGTIKTKAKTLGKLIDDKITYEGLFTNVVMTEISRKDDKTAYKFITQSNGNNTCKSPDGMFPLEMDNDLLQLANLIEEYEG